jgi:hypothetical protein
MKGTKMPEVERCPWCNTVISRSQFVQIEARIREQEQTKQAEVEKRLREQLKAQTQAELDKFKAQAQAELDKQKKTIEVSAKADAAKQVIAATAERDRFARDLKAAQAREAELKASIQKQVDSAVQIKLKEQEAQRSKDLADQRASLQKDRDTAMLKLQAEFNRERESWQTKVKEMERQLQKKTAQDLGDGAEIDLYETLRAVFPDDKITRVQKGQSGADIHQDVNYKGQACGKIVIDSKNRQAWQNAFITKLRQDQTEAGAEHAILSTTVFPSGKKELCIESDVIVTSPARVSHIISLLRRSMITIHVKGLSLNERATKMSRLYKLITSEKYAQRFREVEKLTNEILELDVQEKKAHDNVWRKRGTIATRISNALSEIDTDVAAVIEAKDPTELSVAS